MPPIADKIDLMERFTHLQFVQFLRRGGEGVLEASTGGSPSPLPGPDGERALAAIDWTPVLRDSNSRFDQLTAVMRLHDRADQQRQLTKIDKDIAAMTKRAPEPERIARFLLGSPGQTVSKAIADTFQIFIGLSIDSIRRVQDSLDRNEQVQRNVQIAFALAAYKSDHGNYPAKLDDLAPKYLATVLDDLFSGKAGRLSSLGEGLSALQRRRQRQGRRRAHIRRRPSRRRPAHGHAAAGIATEEVTPRTFLFRIVLRA